MELEKKLRGKVAILLLFAFVLYIGFNYWNNILEMLSKGYDLFFPFIIGGCIAFVLNIPVTFLSRNLLRCKDKGIGIIIRRYNIVISIVISCFIILLSFALITSIVIPNVIEAISILPKAFDSATVLFQTWLDSNTWVSNNAVNLINNIGLDWSSIFNNVKTVFFNGARSALVSTIEAATAFASATVEVILGFMFSIYVLTQKKRLSIQFKKIFYAFMKKEKVDSMLEILRLTSQTFSNFITGQCIVSIILGMMFFVTMMILKLPYALVISISIACLSIIPVLGSILGCALGAFLIVMVSPIKAGIFIIIYLIIKQLEDNIIYPKIVGNSVGLPSMWVLVAITLGGKIFGVAGMIIFIPMFSVAYVLLSKEVNVRLKKKSLEIE